MFTFLCSHYLLLFYLHYILARNTHVFFNCYFISLLLCNEKWICYFLRNVYFSLRDLLLSTPQIEGPLKMGKVESPCFFHNGRVSVPLLRTTLLTRRFSIVTWGDREVSSGQGDESVERCASVGILSSNTGWLMRRRGLRSHSWLELSS